MKTATQESFTEEEVWWARMFLYRHPGPSDPREYSWMIKDWEKAKRIMEWAEAHNE